MEGRRTFLSIIVPFHNSATACGKLLRTLAHIEPRQQVELILVDDGSTDCTLAMLKDFARSARTDVQIIERSNGGPGAARNSGLEQARGHFVWFVDSDDDIDLDAINIAKQADWPEIDLIVWDWRHPTISRKLSPGLHHTKDGPTPPDVLDPVVANWFSMDFLKRTSLRFPENCIYEATPLEAFVLPLLVSNYVTSDHAAYLGSMKHSSVTRGWKSFNPRFYDRLETVSLGRAFVERAALDPLARAPFDTAFIRLYLWYSISLSKLPDASWLRAMRVMRKYRDEARRFGITDDPFDHYTGRSASWAVAKMLWHASAALPPQDRYFDRLRRRAWHRPLHWDSPNLPDQRTWGKG